MNMAAQLKCRTETILKTSFLYSQLEIRLRTICYPNRTISTHAAKKCMTSEIPIKKPANY